MRHHRSLRFVIGASVLACAANAHGQESAGPAGPDVSATVAPGEGEPSDEIVVTVRRLSETLQDVPASITAFSETTLRDAGVERAEDFLALTPGVTLVNTLDAGDSQVNIRGINGARDAENSFAFVLDGILHPNLASFNREFVDLRQIEVLKGPQGAIYGRNAAAGAIIVTTRMPGDELEGSGKLSYGNLDSRFASASIGGPLIADKLAFRLSGDYRNSDGYYRNELRGTRDVDNARSWNLNARAYFTPSTATTLDLKLRYGELKSGAVPFNGNFAIPAFAAFDPLFFEDVNEHEYRFQNNVEPLSRQQAVEASAKLTQDFGDFSLTAWYLFDDIDTGFTADGTSAAFGFFNSSPACISSVATLFAAGFKLPPPTYLGPTPGFPTTLLPPYSATACDGYQHQERNQRDHSAEIRLSSNGDTRLKWLAGLYYLNINREVGVATGIDTGAPAPYALFVPSSSPQSTEQLVRDRFKSDVYAVFGQIVYDLSDEIEGAVALRYDREERRARNLVPTSARTKFVDFDGDFVFAGGAPLNPGLNPAINPSGVIPDQRRTFEQLQPKVSLTWQPSRDLTLYGNWGIGFKSGGFNNQGSDATVDLFINAPLGTNVQINDVYDKETSSAFEAGAKGKLGGVSFNAALYHTTVKDMQFFEFFVGPFGLLRVVANIDKVVLHGGELSLNARPTDWLSLYGSVNITESKIRKSAYRPEAVGNKSPYTPDYTLNAGAQVTVPGWDNVDVLGRVDASVIGPTWFHVVQNQQRPSLFGLADYSRSRRDAFATIDARLGFTSPRWTLTAFARNIFDKKYTAEVVPAPEFGGSFLSPGARRTFGVEASYRF